MVSALDLMASYEEAKAAGLLPEPNLATSIQRTLLAGTHGILAAQHQMVGEATANLGAATFGAAA